MQVFKAIIPYCRYMAGQATYVPSYCMCTVGWKILCEVFVSYVSCENPKKIVHTVGV